MNVNIFVKNMSYSDLYGPAMKITDQAEADAYFEQLVTRNLSFGTNSREQAERIERDNLAYFAGYYDDQTRQRVETLFKCAHPVFGSIAENGPPTTKQAFQMGVAMGADAKLVKKLAADGSLHQNRN